MEMLFHFSVTPHWFGIKVSWDVIGLKNKNKLKMKITNKNKKYKK